MAGNDYRKLRGRIVERYGTLNAFAEALGISYVQASKKVNGKAGFSQKDINEWSDLLGIELEEIGPFFYAHQV